MQIKDLKPGDRVLIEITVDRVDLDGRYLSLVGTNSTIFAGDDGRGKAEIHTILERPISVGDMVQHKVFKNTKYTIEFITSDGDWVVQWDGRKSGVNPIISAGVQQSYERISA